MTTTKLINEVYLEQSEIEKDFKNELVEFLNGNENTQFQEAFNEVTTLLDKNNWVAMKNHFCYDNNIKACWYMLCDKEVNYQEYTSGTDITEALENFKANVQLDLPTETELTKSLTQLKQAPFSLENERPSVTCYILFKKGIKVQGYDCDKGYLKEHDKGRAIPLLRLTVPNNFNISRQQLFFRWLSLGLIPKELEDKNRYMQVLQTFKQYKIITEDFFAIKRVELIDKKIKILKNMLISKLLNEDKIRADLAPYHQKILEDIQQGHWSLYRENGNDLKIPIKTTLNEKLVARDPKSSIVNGVVGIDFGTKSTVVVCQKESTHILPMRIGTGDLGKKIEAHHYENPTIMECNDIVQFMIDYSAREGRPFTKWQDITISHTASNNLLNSKSEYFNAYVNELKQWAGTKTKKLKIKDKLGHVVDLPEFANMGEHDIDPIEIYAYYLGLYINNHNNGIYMNYILSFPVTYEVQIREKILKSFKKGLKKSLPQELHNQKDEIAKLSVIQGASEPAAYAAVALQEYGFTPEGDERLFYGVFDFGGGTTDFDFGIYRESQGKKERRYDYTIEHFGAGGDRYLGGENILELLAFELFKANREKLLESKIQFIKPVESKEFLGGEQLLSLSREAKLNTKVLMEKLRPFWEADEARQGDFDQGSIALNLLDVDAKQHVNFELDLDKEALESILKKRIQKGVENFFNALREVFSDPDIDLSDIKTIHIFLAGNSSKSKILQELFESAIEAESKKFKERLSNTKELFKVFEPLSNEDDFEKPNGKTGVAFGLIETRKSGDIYVIDHNVQLDGTRNEIDFKYYLGESRKKKFKVLVERSMEYNRWIDFTDASVDTFEVYYASQSTVTTNKVKIHDESIKKIILTIDVTDDDALVYLRLVTPTEFEYVVAYEEKIEQSEYLSEIKKVSL